MSEPVSAAWLAAWGAEHGVTASCDVLRSGGVIKANLPIESGTVHVDRTSTIRRSVQALTVIDPTGALVPRTGLDTLAPYGNELAVYAGFRYADGTTEKLPLGIFGLSKTSIQSIGIGGKITLSSFDRSRKIARNKWTDTYIVAEGTNVVQAMQRIVTDRLPGTSFSVVSTTSTTPLLTFDVDTDPWQAVSDMATSIGYEVFFNRRGVCVMRPVPNPSATLAAWRFVGGNGGTLKAITNEYTDDPGYNGCVVIAENSANPVPYRAVAWDISPASPSYYLGPYGKVPQFRRSSLPTSQAQAQAMASAIVLSSLGMTQVVTFDAIPNYAMDEADVVRVTHTPTGVDAAYLMDAFDLPLGPLGSMPCTVRQNGALL